MRRETPSFVHSIPDWSDSMPHLSPHLPAVLNIHLAQSLRGGYLPLKIRIEVTNFRDKLLGVVAQLAIAKLRIFRPADFLGWMQFLREQIHSNASRPTPIKMSNAIIGCLKAGFVATFENTGYERNTTRRTPSRRPSKHIFRAEVDIPLEPAPETTNSQTLTSQSR